MERLFPGVPPAPEPGSSADYREAVERTRRNLASRVGRLEEEVAQAPHLLTELLQQPAGARRELIRNQRDFRSAALARLLLDCCREAWISDTQAAGEYARLVLEMVDGLEPGEAGRAVRHDLGAQAWGYLANVQRIRSELRDAEASFARAERALEEGSGDPLLEAEILDLKASFYRAQRRFEDALELLDRVTEAYSRLGDRHRVGRSLVSQATVHGYAGRPERSVELLRSALEQIDPEVEPRVHLAALEQLVLFLNELGRHREAQALLPQVRVLADGAGSRRDGLRVAWLEAKISLSLGDEDQAERGLKAVREGFIQQGFGYEAALASLDLACIYLRQGRSLETRQLAAQMLPVFQSLEIHREAFAALMVFRRAVELDTVTLGMVEDIATFLKRTRQNPDLRFEESS